jgi:hypothetical protein
MDNYKFKIIDNVIIWKSPDIEWVKKHIEELDKYYKKVINGFLGDEVNEKT